MLCCVVVCCGCVVVVIVLWLSVFFKVLLLLELFVFCDDVWKTFDACGTWWVDGWKDEQKIKRLE